MRWRQSSGRLPRSACRSLPGWRGCRRSVQPRYRRIRSWLMGQTISAIAANFVLYECYASLQRAVRLLRHCTGQSPLDRVEQDVGGYVGSCAARAGCRRWCQAGTSVQVQTCFQRQLVWSGQGLPLPGIEQFKVAGWPLALRFGLAFDQLCQIFGERQVGLPGLGPNLGFYFIRYIKMQL